ncbi:MAG: DUF1080 domain-containing protein, partial [Lentisphaeraceae bacterium]|nr:DUF1080 domain-containing protein [Lentisphaeraceae bacterium]
AASSIFAQNNVSESQSKWFKKYKSQKNIPKLEETKINKDAEPALNEGFVNLYNGKDLTGWVPKGGTCKFEAKGDVILGTCVKGSPSTYLSTEKADYSDFIFTCEIKWIVDGNTGVMFRAQSKPGKKGQETVFGPQAEMEGLAQGRGWSGGIYGQACGGYFYPLWLDAHKDARNALKKDEFNRITIKAQGGNVKTWINGIPAANWDTDEYMKGFFGLQIHSGKKGTVEFKNIKVKELK